MREDVWWGYLFAPLAGPDEARPVPRRERSRAPNCDSATLTTPASVAGDVTEDASLDAFAGSDEAAASDGEPIDDAADGLTETAADGDESESADETAPSVSPATSTYDWSPEGGECADCGASVERRWRDGEALVCGDCKEW